MRNVESDGAFDGLTGREAELERLMSFVDRGQPALVVLSGPAGMGKTTLVRAVQALPAVHGWTLVPESDGDAQLAVGWSTTPEGFTLLVRRRLGFVSDDDVDQQPALAGMLAEHAPLLLTVEVNRPTNAFAAWVAGELMQDLRVEEAAVVVVAVTASDSVERLISSGADAVIRLGPLAPEAVRAALQQLPSLDPPLESPELEVYIEAGSKTPALITSFLRLLPHARAAP